MERCRQEVGSSCDVAGPRREGRMLAKVNSCAIVGLEGAIVEVEVDLSRGLFFFAIVGLPDAAVQESKERVRSAIRNSGADFWNRRIAVNLAPADLRKEGPSYDLPIAVGILMASGQVPSDCAGQLFLGELSLDGAVKHTNGVLPMVATAKDHGIGTVFVPTDDAPEASLIEGPTIIPVSSLAQLIAHLRGMALIPPYTKRLDLDAAGHDPAYASDFQFIKGQEHVKRALEVAAAGGHNVIMTGPPGAGKTLLARSVPSILPRMTIDEALEVTKIYSVAGLLPTDTPLVINRPFRAPHHTVSYAALVGGGKWPRPGEVSLAHHGVLFLDELPEFDQRTLEVLRQPLEDHVAAISRVQGTVTFPASFIFIGAANPCPCGYRGDPRRECTCSESMVTRYSKRVSGPLLDRIDIHVEVPRVDYEKLADDRLGESSSSIRTRVEAAREVQRRRFKRVAGRLGGKGGPPLRSNADMGPAEIRQFCPIDSAGQSMLRAAMNQLHLSARAYHRVLKLARTIADLAGSEEIRQVHLAEAIQYRPRSVA